jgi:hypothetical protein
LWFLDDNDWVKMMIGLTEFALKVATLGTRPMKGGQVVVKNLKKQESSRKDRFPKTLFALSRCRIAEDNGFEDLLSRRCTSTNEMK